MLGLGGFDGLDGLDGLDGTRKVALVAQDARPAPASGKTLGQFLKYAACRGQIGAQSLGYGVLPPNLVEGAFPVIREINGASNPGPLTAKNCPNPYLTGTLAPPAGRS
jgi:hypothetical protein